MFFEAISGEMRAKKLVSGAIDSGRISGAYVFSGHDIDSMMAFARETAKALNCTDACGKCSNCRKIDKDIHPDLIIVRPEGKKGVIKIESVRNLKERVNIGPTEGKWLVVCFERADSIETAAANSFLKVLEEPPANVLFILTTVRPDMLPKTVMSRCQKIIFTTPAAEENEDVEMFRSRSIPDLLEFSAGIAERGADQERSATEAKLNFLLDKFWEKKMVKETKSVLKTIIKLKRMANARMSLDRMALTIGGHLDG